VEERKDQERPVPRAPERALPAELHELEVDARNALVENVHDEDVADGEPE
jgi:hypothetical protein